MVKSGRCAMAHKPGRLLAILYPRCRLCTVYERAGALLLCLIEYAWFSPKSPDPARFPDETSDLTRLRENRGRYPDVHAGRALFKISVHLRICLALPFKRGFQAGQ